jgi:hypothetical protein
LADPTPAVFSQLFALSYHQCKIFPIQCSSIVLRFGFGLLFIPIKSLASSIDIFDKDGFFQHRYRDHAWRLLTGIPSKANFSGQSGYFGHLMLGYQLLDTLLWCSFWPCHPTLSHIKRKPTPASLPTKLLTITKALSNWADPITKAKRSRGDKPLPPQSLVLTQVGSAEELTYAIAMNNLRNSVLDYKASHWHHILMNIHSVAFIVRWHSPVTLSYLFHNLTDMQLVEFTNT